MSNLTEKVWFRFLVIIIAIISPFVCLFSVGELDSYSEYWTSDLRPLFIFTNAATSYFLFSMRNWWLSAVCLMLLTAFSFDQYLWVHNISAISFFIFSGIAISKSRKFQYYILPYISSIIVLLYYGIFWAEVSGIVVVSCYHLHRLITYIRLSEHRKKHKSL
jgi:hypothetical protein